MTGKQFITEAQALGLRFHRNGDKLAVDAEPGSMTPDVRAWLKDEKATILRALTEAQKGSEQCVTR